MQSARFDESASHAIAALEIDHRRSLSIGRLEIQSSDPAKNGTLGCVLIDRRLVLLFSRRIKKLRVNDQGDGFEEADCTRSRMIH